jgi:hypothetical protein
MSRYSLAVVVALAVVVLCPAASLASGGSSIASAPTLVYGQLENGGGTHDEYWHLQTYAGDKLTMDIDFGSNNLGTIDVWAPAVTDYTIKQAQAYWSKVSDGYELGKFQFHITSPFTGLNTMAICARNGGDCNPATSGGINTYILTEPFSFTITDAHQTSLAITAPRLARRGATITVRAAVRSSAGTPEGACLIQGAEAPLAAGQCSKRVRLGHGRRQTIRVSFVPDDGWQPTSGRRTIRLAR